MSSSGSRIALSFILATVIGLSAGTRADSSYDEFRQTHRSGQQDEDTVSYAERNAMFEVRKAEVIAHNARKESWTLTLNRFADFTAAELQGMMGYKPARRARSSAESSFLQTGGDGSGIGVNSIDTTALAKTVDWRSKMNFSNFVHDQGTCGSCWAHAAVAALEARADLSDLSTGGPGISTALATQEIIDCSANPQHCGGKGGCEGSTAEIAFQYARTHGIRFKDAFSKGCSADASAGQLKIHSYVRLPENRASHLLNALATNGPVVMSIDANSLHLYDSGVFGGCQPDTIVNHAVLGVGYGTDEKFGKEYFLIKNSWGASWGESGYFRVEKQDNDEFSCGMDNKPQDGVYCDKHPASIRVCGMCGIASDSAYPVILDKEKVRLDKENRFGHQLRQPSPLNKVVNKAAKVHRQIMNLFSVF